MIEIIKNRPLAHYYLWQVYRQIKKPDQEEYHTYVSKQIIGQVNAIRRKLEQVNDARLSSHIVCLAFLEETLGSLSELEFEQLLEELQATMYSKKINSNKSEPEKNEMHSLKMAAHQFFYSVFTKTEK
ncbi:hypothetical protein [Enterococcus sp. DIV1420a]|uniref:hypothetical protein n=1 Tax=Enterococcus TaxID=1350 RepID=UPI003F1FB05E